MKLLLPPACFLVALAMLIVGFCLLAVDGPEASIELHRARSVGDDAFTAVLEQDLHNRVFYRQASVAFAFVGSVFMTVIGFKAMRFR